jgi:hypothetical protein
MDTVESVLCLLMFVDHAPSFHALSVLKVGISDSIADAAV